MCIQKRNELLFCYDVTDANPNGDPLDENKPRIDEETKINIVTDVRLKRTIRDYLYEYKGYNGKNGQDIFVREIIFDEEGHIQDAKLRIEDFLLNENGEIIKKSEIKNIINKDKPSDSECLNKMKELIIPNLLNQCIDVRLFGATIPVEYKNTNSGKGSITFTGPVQFKMGRSLNKVELRLIKGTGAFASTQDATQSTFREEYILPYSFICFHGIINEAAAQHTKLSEKDINELLDAIWNGTKNLISRSKFGQMPRFLLRVTYKDKGFFIGDLDKKVKLVDYENEFKIRGVKDFRFDISELIDVFNSNQDKIEKIEYAKDSDLKIKGEIPQEWNKLAL
jgi:CRISPR-associated protein Csh2